MAQLIFALGTFVMIGFVWFYVARPALEGLGLIVNNNEDSAPVVMSRSEQSDYRLSALSLETDELQTADRRTMPVPTREEMLDIFKALRAAGVKRENIAGVWRAAGLPLDTNLWAAAAPPPAQTVTPIAGRPTSAVFDPDFPYVQPPA